VVGHRAVIEWLDGMLGRESEDRLSAWKRNVCHSGWDELLERVQSGQSYGIVVWHRPVVPTICDLEKGLCTATGMQFQHQAVSRPCCDQRTPD
jgi:hypothetical protein